MSAANIVRRSLNEHTIVSVVCRVGAFCAPAVCLSLGSEGHW